MTPKFFETAFTCPYCVAFSQQDWYDLTARKLDVASMKLLSNKSIGSLKSVDQLALKGHGTVNGSAVKGGHVALCVRCQNVTFWLGDKLIFPAPRTAHLPHRDMPEEIRADFEEAAQIADLSPRGAAALLRLALEKLCGILGDPTKKTNTNIKTMVENGLSVKVQQALDAVRVIGAEAVHPLTMDLKDDKKTVDIMFGLINLIVNSMITEPNHVEAIYNKLPEEKRAGIENRDKKPDS